MASVVVDLDSPGAEGIRVAVAPDADEEAVLERVNALLVAYGIRSEPFLSLMVGRKRVRGGRLDVDVRITPIKGGARVEVIGSKIRSFRIVPPNAVAIAQGIADAWCQVAGRIPVEIVRVSIAPGRVLVVVSFDGKAEKEGSSDITDGWLNALTMAVGTAIGVVEA